MYGKYRTQTTDSYILMSTTNNVIELSDWGLDKTVTRRLSRKFQRVRPIATGSANLHQVILRAVSDLNCSEESKHTQGTSESLNLAEIAENLLIELNIVKGVGISTKYGGSQGHPKIYIYLDEDTKPLGILYRYLEEHKKHWVYSFEALSANWDPEKHFIEQLDSATSKLLQKIKSTETHRIEEKQFHSLLLRVSAQDTPPLHSFRHPSELSLELAKRCSDGCGRFSEFQALACGHRFSKDCHLTAECSKCGLSCNSAVLKTIHSLEFPPVPPSQLFICFYCCSSRPKTERRVWCMNCGLSVCPACVPPFCRCGVPLEYI